MKTVKLTVPDMACGHCANTVEEALQNVEGVDSVDVSLDDKEARVSVSESVADEALAAAVKDAGYTPEV